MLMKCPSCENGQLHYAYLDDHFPCKTCDNCGGNWVLLEDYLRWKDSQPQLNQLPDNLKIELTETKKALLCPVTGTIMLKYRISNQIDHRLDLSPAVNGIWLDKGEWLLLKQAGLAEKLNNIFTAPWQKQIRTEASVDVFDQLYRERFGEEDYQQLKSIREWLNNHPQAEYLKAFIVADDPWSALK